MPTPDKKKAAAEASAADAEKAAAEKAAAEKAAAEKAAAEKKKKQKVTLENATEDHRAKRLTKCPETGRSITHIDSHIERDMYALSVWGVHPQRIKRLSAEGQKRYILVIGYDPTKQKAEEE